MTAPTLAYRAALRSRLRNTFQQRRWQSTNNNTTTTTKPEDPIPVPNTVPTTSVPFWLRLGPLTRATQAYGRAQRKRPWTVQLCTSLTIFFLGDISAQRIGGRDYDPERTGRSLIIGGLISIPNYEWYALHRGGLYFYALTRLVCARFMFLSRNFNYSSRLLSIATKIVVNQALFTPLFNSYFFGMQALLAGDNLVEVWGRIKRTVPTSMVNSVKLWPAVTAINFTFIPIEYRSVFAGVIAVGWQTYLSWLNRLAEEAEARERPSGRIPPSSIRMVAA